MILSQLRPALVMFTVLTVVCGVAYPLAVTGVAQLVFPRQANGSLVVDQDGQVVGSELIGQQVDDPGHFWGRLSATSPAYNGAASSGSNDGPLNPAVGEASKGRVHALQEADPDNTTPIPVDLATASASGLDPHISPEAAYWQVPRVAKACGLDEADVRKLVQARVEGRTLGFLGEPRVNVFLLNRDLDATRREQAVGQDGAPR